MIEFLGTLSYFFLKNVVMRIKEHTNDPMMNKLLAALPAEEFKNIESALKPVSLSSGEIVKEADVEIKFVYFPTTAIISLFHLMEDGTTVDIALFGNDGILGFSLFMGGNTTPQWAVSRNNGNAFRLPAKLIQKEFSHCGDFQDLMLLYAQTSMTYISQSAVCNRLHSVEQRLCRNLLVYHDLQQTNKFKITHEVLANMLGVRREGVSIAAANLQKKKLIKYVRGTITMLDRQGLENAACECYQIVHEEYDRLLGKYISKNR